MHPALQNPFLLAEIFKFLESPTSETKPWIIACALTCKTFLSPALDTIWREIIDVHPLFHLIPGIKSRDLIWGGVKLITLYTEKSLLPQDLQRLRFYANRVRILNNRCPFIDSDGNMTAVDPDPSFVIQLLSLLEGKPLTPSIQSLYIVLPTRADRVVICSPYHQLLLCPSLQNVTLYSRSHAVDFPVGEIHAPVAWSFLNSLASVPIPGLRELNLESVPIPVGVLFSVTQLRTLQSLHLRISALDHYYLSHIRRLLALERLTELHLGFEGVATTVRAPQKPAGALDSLKKLVIQGSVDLSSLILSTFNFLSLEYLAIGPWKELDATGVSRASWERCFSQLQNVGNCLQILRLDGWTSLSVTLPWTSFTPLLFFHHLRYVIIKEPKISSLSNKIVAEMISAWPKLQRLSIKTNDASNLNHLALHQIAVGLPELISLDIGMNLLDASPEALPMDVVPHYQLESITIPHIPIHEEDLFRLGPKKMHDIARYLDILFPKVIWVDVLSAQGGECIRDMVKGLKDTRERERIRLAAGDQSAPTSKSA
ncbi:hypothetical protein BJ165DRAFT_215755 [Panaeolus papilionaceus]|nr:hypothetical protein BJ165DRAFT_215755 [Panaeolus papilionaceus]